MAMHRMWTRIYCRFKRYDRGIEEMRGTDQLSLDAWINKVVPNLNKRQMEVYKAIGWLGMATSTQIGNYLRLPINCITGRVMELRKKNLVVCAYDDACPITGRKAAFWSLK